MNFKGFLLRIADAPRGRSCVVAMATAAFAHVTVTAAQRNANRCEKSERATTRAWDGVTVAAAEATAALRRSCGLHIERPNR